MTVSGDKSSHFQVMNIPDEVKIFDFTNGYDPDKIEAYIYKDIWGIGKYNEERKNMYVAPQYENRRNIHMGIDIWAKEGEQVFSVLDGIVLYKANHDDEGNYGPTIVLEHQFESRRIFALYGHLSIESIESLETGSLVSAGSKIARLGHKNENGGWPPHLHYQLSWADPGEADMPGVVSKEERKKAVAVYPDPAILIGSLY